GTDGELGEAFADRAYLPNGALVPRGTPGAVITDPEQVAERAVRMATHRSVVAVDGTVIPCSVDSICVHGDTPGAVSAAELVRATLIDADITLAPFA
ncbi:LamB/YcsF family protein, partial [Micromonospora sp. M51]|uniref:LamB/YcsF family protein n=1 Tax=Micromonospora sp. M51 TaxID=2824889 RepID=UPI001B39B861